VKKTPATHLQKNQILLETARSKASEVVQIRWHSEDLGSWEAVNPRWQVLGGRMRFQFYAGDCRRSYWIVSVRQKAWGLSIFLLDPRNPVPDVFEIAWERPASGFRDPRRAWKIAKRWLVLRFPAHRILRATKRPDLARTLSGSFLRVLFRHGGKNCLLIAADPDSGDEIHLAIGQALLWLSTLAPRERPKTVPVLYFLAPSDASAILAHRCRFLNKSRIKAEIWEYNEKIPGNPDIHRAPAPPPPEENKDYRWPVLGPFRWSSPLQRVLDLAPELIRRYPRFQDYDSLRLWGLEFAQVMGADRDRIFFGVGAERTELREDNYEVLRSLIHEILFYRRPDTPDIRHPYYRLQAERWLEALILEDIPHLFPEMAPESVYSQIPVYLGKDSGRIDILGADREGTLVVMELKVSADCDLPMQAVDYWGRVIQHNENGDFERRGYFSEIRLTRHRPKIYLVSPVFSFHDTTESLLRYLEPDLEVWKISINEDWRCGVGIIRRIQYLCEELD
jgi:hypothetical protein